VDFVVDKLALEQFFFEHFGFPYQLFHILPTVIIIIIRHPGLVQYVKQR
jgi:hypothetical protein